MTQVASQFVAQAILRCDEDASAWLKPFREAGRSRWSELSLPNRKTENWRYTSLRSLERGDYLAEPAQSDVEGFSPENVHVKGLDGSKLVFLDGVFSPELSNQMLPEGLSLVPFTQSSEAHRKLILQNLGEAVNHETSPFASLNDSWLKEGVFLSVDRNTKLDKPIHVVWITTKQERNFSVNQRMLVLMETGSEASVVEHYCSGVSEQNSFTNAVSEFIVQKNAKLTHYRLHLEEEHSLHIGGIHVQLHRDAVFNSFQIALGGVLKRLDIDVSLIGEGAHCELSGVYLPRDKQVIDFHTAMRHMVPHCTSNEVYRGIVADQSRAIFNGLIYIHPQAQKTVAQLSNKNLLTSDQAEVDTKPELQIYANDVLCAHGATVAQIDEQLLYYLCSRGIDRQEAEVILSFGFINELLNRLSDAPIQEYLRPILASQFAQSSDLARYIA